MKLVRWSRFTWDLKKLPETEPRNPANYVIRPATREEEKLVQNVIFAAFSLDSSWGDAFKSIRGFIEAQLTQSFLEGDTPALVITHGTRIIAASAINTDEAAITNLVSGPCVLAEYCNRGLGTILLYESLKMLKKCGLQKATGVTKDGVPVSKFLYPKYESISEEFDRQQLMVAAS